MSSIYSNKQKELLKTWQSGNLKRINILEGSVRSGKTWISLVLWAFWVATMPSGESFLMAAKTLSALKRNVLELLTELVGEENFTYSLSKKEGRFFGRLIYFESSSDIRAESKIRGMTLAGAYCDELTLFGEDFFAMLLSRLSVKGAKLFATTNPDSPNHWLMQKYLKRAGELDMLSVKFSIDDNSFLDADYVNELKKEYAGVFYERFILGRWVVAEGLVYPMFDQKKHVIKDNGEDGLYYISIDYGTVNPFSAGLWRISNGRAVRISEFYYSGALEKKQKTDEEYYSEIEKLAKGYTIQCVVIDPSAASFIETIKRHGKFSVKKAVNDVCDGIRVVSSLLCAEKIFFDQGCSATIREFGIYSWDERSGEDRVKKESDHAMDEIRYFCSTILKREFKWDSWAVK